MKIQLLFEVQVDELILITFKTSILVENNNLIKSGSYVAADNVVVARHQLQSYRDYMAHKQQILNVVQTQMIEQQLEYSDQNDPSFVSLFHL